MHTHMHRIIYICTHTCIHTYTHTYVRMYVRTYMHACMHAYIHMCIYNTHNNNVMSRGPVAFDATRSPSGSLRRQWYSRARADQRASRVAKGKCCEGLASLATLLG